MLITSAIEGDAGDKRRLFERFHRQVMAYCLVATRRDREVALDLCQEAFCNAFRNLGQLRDPRRFESWLFAIVANVCRLRLKQEARKRVLLSQLALQSDDTIEEDFNEPVKEEQLQVIRKIMQSIEDPTLRDIVLLRYSEPEHTTIEISKRLQIPLGTVTVKLVRFRAAIKKELLRQMLIPEVGKEVSA